MDQQHLFYIITDLSQKLGEAAIDKASQAYVIKQQQETIDGLNLRLEEATRNDDTDA